MFPATYNRNDVEGGVALFTGMYLFMIYSLSAIKIAAVST